MTFNEFVAFADLYAYQNCNMRYGQALFNALNEVHPALSSMIHGSTRDPFYQNTNIADFWLFVEENWNVS